jgi:hypothetical protein
MGRQINFYLLPEDTDIIEKVLREKVEISFWEDISNSPAPEEASSLKIESMGKSPLTVYLSLPKHGKDIVCKQVQNQGYWTVDDLRSPVLEFSRCYFDGVVLRRGRFFYQTGYYGDDDNWVDKPESFIKWAEKIFRLLKKLLKKPSGQDYYFGEQALKWIETGAIKADPITWEKRSR